MRDGWGRFALLASLAALPARAMPPTDPPLPPPRPQLAPAAVPLPPPRPPDLGPPRPAATPSSPPPGVPAEPAPPQPGPPIPTGHDEACLRLLGSGKVVARALPPIAGTGGCGIAAPIELSAFIITPAQRVRIEPPVTIDCPLGDALADWVRDDLARTFTASSPLAALTGTAGYACRSRDSLPGARLSEHATGNAMDIGAFVAADGGSISLGAGDTAFLDAVRTTACARFSTVLGPGADAFHASHLHVDLAARRNGGRICQWRTVPSTPRGPR